MRSMYRTLALAGMGLLLIPHVAAATDVEAEIRQVQERLSEIEQQLEVTNEELADANATVAAQQATIEAAGLEERDGSSGISAFIESTDIAAWVATSYNYNFMNPPQGRTNNDPTGITGLLNTHPQHNNFQLDQLHFGMANEANEDSRAGFGLDILS